MDIHPAAAAWPVPLLFLAIVFFLLGLRESGEAYRRSQSIVFVFALLGVVASFFSGYRANELAEGTFVYPGEALALHHFWGKITLFSTILSIGIALIAPRAKFGQKWWRVAAFTSLIVALAAAGATSWLGGKAVFEHGAGVRAPIKDIKESGRP